MLISVQHIIRHSRRSVFLSAAVAVMYLLVVNYSLSHVHPPQVEHDEAFFLIGGINKLAQIQQLTHQHDESHEPPQNWQSDRQHTHGCSLVAQAAASLAVQKHQALFVNIYNDVHRLLSLNVATPIKKIARAPPASEPDIRLITT